MKCENEGQKTCIVGAHYVTFKKLCVPMHVLYRYESGKDEIQDGLRGVAQGHSSWVACMRPWAPSPAWKGEREEKEEGRGGGGKNSRESDS